VINRATNRYRANIGFWLFQCLFRSGTSSVPLPLLLACNDVRDLFFFVCLPAQLFQADGS
jgi:hypothetical protein